MAQEQTNIEGLYNAALEGNTTSLLNLLQKDPLILDRYMIEKSSAYAQSPLHAAVNAGHIELIKTLLDQKPELADVVDQVRMWSPLHMASAKANIEIVNILVRLKPTMCLARDKDGLTPIHVAALERKDKEEVEILELRNVLKALHDANNCAAQERTNNGETILHLCVKHGKFEALKKLVQLIEGDGDQLINFKDINGNTILHLAVTNKQPKIVEHLLKDCKSRIEINALNNKDMTAADVYKKQSKINKGDITIERSLRRVKAKGAKKTLDYQAQRLENQREALMVVASLIATMAFQAGTNPPGGVYQDTMKGNHEAGFAIWAYYFKDIMYNIALISNTVGFVASISVIMLLISGLPFTRDFLIIILRVTLWIAVVATSITYAVSLYYVTRTNDPPLFETLLGAYIVWLNVIVAILISNVVRFLAKTKKMRSIIRYFKYCFIIARGNTSSHSRHTSSLEERQARPAGL